MIITRLAGGLGNQMFQYAAGRALALKHGTELKLDLSWFSSWQFPSIRNYEISCFNIIENIAQKEDIKRLKGTALIPKNILTYSWDIISPFRKRTYFKEKDSSYNKEFAELGTDAYLYGYWQSERYFSGIADILRSDFTLRNEVSYAGSDIPHIIEQPNAVALHIRLGDYLSNKFTYNLHGVCNPEYYRKAIETISEKIANPVLIIFSDDRQAAEKYLNLRHEHYFAEGSRGRGWEDLMLMKRCRNFIIANSSFSWWGAWLSAVPDKTVIAPKRWFNKQNKSSADIVPEGWIRL